MVDSPEVGFAPAQQIRVDHDDPGNMEKVSIDIVAAPTESVHNMYEKSQGSMFAHPEEVYHVKQGSTRDKCQ